MIGRMGIGFFWIAAALTLGAGCSDAHAPDDRDVDNLGATTQALTGTRVPMYELYNSVATDHFYTISASVRDQVLGYNDGWQYLGIPYYLESALQPNTAALRRFYKYLPQRDHFYTMSASEVNYVLANGYTDEGNEGYIYTAQVAGSIPLYRVSMFNAANSDLDHRYTTDWTLTQSMVGQGWGYDGVAGYVFAAPEAVGGRT